MTDEQLVTAFESGSLPPARFGHREHVRVAWCYLCRHPRHEAERRMLEGLRAFAARAGKPDKFDAALTHRWMSRIATATARCGPAATFDDLVAAAPDLLERGAAAAHATV